MRRAISLSVVFMASVAALGVAQDHPTVSTKPTPVRALAFSPDGQILAVAYGSENELAIWEVAGRKKRSSIKEKSAIRTLAYSPQGDALAIIVGKVAKLLDPATGDVRRELTGHDKNIRSVAFMPDGKQLATASEDHSVRLWDIAAGQPRRIWTKFPGDVISLAVSSDGKWLATCCRSPDAGDNEVNLWNLETPDQAARKIETSGYIPQVVFSPDGRSLIIPSWISSLLVIDVATGDERMRFANTGGANGVAVSPDNKTVVVMGHRSAILDVLPLDSTPNADRDREIAALIEQFQDDDYAHREAASSKLATLGADALTQLRTALNSPSAEVRMRCRRLVERIRNAEFAPKLTGHEADVTCVTFSPVGQLLASGDSKGIVKLWDMAQAKELATLTPN